MGSTSSSRNGLGGGRSGGAAGRRHSADSLPGAPRHACLMGPDCPSREASGQGRDSCRVGAAASGQPARPLSGSLPTGEGAWQPVEVWTQTYAAMVLKTVAVLAACGPSLLCLHGSSPEDTADDAGAPSHKTCIAKMPGLTLPACSSHHSPASPWLLLQRHMGSCGSACQLLPVQGALSSSQGLAGDW